MQRKNIKSSNGKAINIYKGIPIRLSADFFSRNTAGQKARNIYSDEREKSTTKNILLNKALIQI